MCVYQRERERERYNVLRCVRECTPRYVMDEPDEVSLKKISFNCHSLSKYEMLNKGWTAVVVIVVVVVPTYVECAI